MTTIAWDGRFLASDSAVTGSYMSTGYDKIFEGPVTGSIYACCGERYKWDAFISWMEGSEEVYDENLNGGWAVLVWNREEQVMYVFEGVKHGFPINAPYAMGSGGDFAQAAMILGHSAEDAVDVAIRLDPHSGGDIKILDLKYEG